MPKSLPSFRSYIEVMAMSYSPQRTTTSLRGVTYSSTTLKSRQSGILQQLQYIKSLSKSLSESSGYLSGSGEMKNSRKLAILHVNVKLFHGAISERGRVGLN